MRCVFILLAVADRIFVKQGKRLCVIGILVKFAYVCTEIFRWNFSKKKQKDKKVIKNRRSER